MYKTVSEIKSKNRDAGFFWFSQDCRVETPLQSGRFWVESRPMDGEFESFSGEEYTAQKPLGTRSYAAVQADADGSVGWVDSDATRLPTLAEAQAQINAILGQ